jgi:hypothetical protein
MKNLKLAIFKHLPKIVPEANPISDLVYFALHKRQMVIFDDFQA